MCVTVLHSFTIATIIKYSGISTSDKEPKISFLKKNSFLDEIKFKKYFSLISVLKY